MDLDDIDFDDVDPDVLAYIYAIQDNCNQYMLMRERMLAQKIKLHGMLHCADAQMVNRIDGNSDKILLAVERGVAELLVNNNDSKLDDVLKGVGVPYKPQLEVPFQVEPNE